MMALRSARRFSPLLRIQRHLATVPETDKVKKNREDLHQYNKQSLIVYGPLVNAPPRKRKYKPVHYKTPQNESEIPYTNFEFVDIETENESVNNLLPIVNIQIGDNNGRLDLNEILAQPLLPGRGTDPELCRIHGHKPEMTVQLRKKPSVTHILDKTMPPRNREMLERWKKQQIELLGLEGFNQMQKETLATGHELHACISDFLSGQSEYVLDMTSEVREGLWASVRHVLYDVTDVRFSEESVTHDRLLYSGIVDCVAQYSDTVCVIDWKTSRKKKPTLRLAYDNPLQLAAYAGALNYSTDIKTQQGVLVYAYTDGSPADALFVSAPKMQHYWSLWLQRLQTYWRMTLDETENKT